MSVDAMMVDRLYDCVLRGERRERKGRCKSKSDDECSFHFQAPSDCAGKWRTPAPPGPGGGQWGPSMHPLLRSSTLQVRDGGMRGATPSLLESLLCGPLVSSQRKYMIFVYPVA